MAYTNQPVLIFNQPVRFYIEAAVRPFVILSAILSFLFLISFWLQLSYLSVAAPIVLFLQIAMACYVGWKLGVIAKLNWRELMLVAGLVGAGAGFVSAVWSLVRFWYVWLAFNLITEPVLSALLASVVSIITVWFFKSAGVFGNKESRITNHE
ncbi:MAG: hypothetical protein AAB657_01545 [Patescibacteria group bacterium]